MALTLAPRRHPCCVLPSGMPRFALVRGGAGPGLLLGLCLGLLALGPGLRRGFLLSYDMVFVPREPFAAALPGLAPPRAVPSDLAVAVASRVVPADIVQKVILLAFFALACAGVAALLDREPVLARLAGGVFFAWNPYVGERLIIGQWALLLGYAGLPWVLRATLSHDLVSRRGIVRLILALLPAAVGGYTAMSITALVIVPAAVLTRSGRRAAVALGGFAACCLPWLIPSLLHPVYTDPTGVAAFASRADTPFGGLGSLLMLSGIWNAQTEPKGYGGGWSALWLVLVLIAVAGYVVFGYRQRRWPGLGVAAAAGLLIACVSLSGPGQHLLRSLISAWPAAGVLREAQQYVAPLALAEACGFGMSVAWAVKSRTGEFDLAGTILGAVALLAPVALLPGLAWGAGGRLRPVWYPPGWVAAAREINGSPDRGAVLLLPWATYRTPAWNHGEVVLDPWPRLLSRLVIWNDGTQVGDLTLQPDDPRARALDGPVDGAGPLTAVLRAAGVRFVLDDADGDAPSGQQVSRRLPGAVVIISQPGLTVYRLRG
jgi:hypothetical protein